MATEAFEVLPEAEQLELLDPSAYPRRFDVEALVKGRSFLTPDPVATLRAVSNQRTGKILIKRLRNEPEFAEALCAALVLGMSARMAALRFVISPESVAAVREAMTERGELRAVRLRVQAKIDRLAEDGLDEVHRGLMAGRIHPGQAWIPTLATVDKRGQLEVGVVPGTERTVEEISADRLMAARDLVLAHRDLQRLASDSASGATATEVTVDTTATDVPPAPATGPATGLALPEAPLARPARRSRSRAGGGIGAGARPAIPQPDRPGNSTA